MSNRLLLPSLLTLSALGLAACGEETTQPNTAADQPSVPQLAIASNTWLSRRNMPLDLLYQATAVVPNAAGQSILYVMGGAKTDSPLPGNPVPMGEVRAYNVATNSWTWKRDMPSVRWDMKAAVINGKVYVPGGWTLQRKPTASLYVYNPASDTWARKRDMPAAGGGGVTAVIGGKLYVVTFSAYSADAVVNFFRYNPTTDSWTRLPRPTNYSILDVGGGVFNNKLYLIGPNVLVYDPITNQWTRKAAWGRGLEGPTVVLRSHMYVFGADLDAGGGPSPGIFIYDPVTDTWEKKPLLTKFAWHTPYGLAAARVFLDGEPRVEVVGGERGWPGSPGNNQQYIP